jgi:hypothetical protein
MVPFSISKASISLETCCGPISRKSAEGSREFWPLAWAKERSASERFLDSSLRFISIQGRIRTLLEVS